MYSGFHWLHFLTLKALNIPHQQIMPWKRWLVDLSALCKAVNTKPASGRVWWPCPGSQEATVTMAGTGSHCHCSWDWAGHRAVLLQQGAAKAAVRIQTSPGNVGSPRASAGLSPDWEHPLQSSSTPVQVLGELLCHCPCKSALQSCVPTLRSAQGTWEPLQLLGYLQHQKSQHWQFPGAAPCAASLQGSWGELQSQIWIPHWNPGYSPVGNAAPWSLALAAGSSMALHFQGTRWPGSDVPTVQHLKTPPHTPSVTTWSTQSCWDCSQHSRAEFHDRTNQYHQRWVQRFLCPDLSHVPAAQANNSFPVGAPVGSAASPHPPTPHQAQLPQLPIPTIYCNSSLWSSAFFLPSF